MEEHQWYVIQVMSGQEKKIKHRIQEHAPITQMTEHIEEILIPSEKVAEVKRGEQKISEKRLWPGYVLIKMKLTDDSWQYIKGINGVIDFMGGGEPVSLSKQEVEEILLDLQQRKGEIVHKNKLQVGDSVKITDGVFINFTGTIQEVNHEKGKISVKTSIFGRETCVEDLEFWQVEEVPLETL